MMSDALTIFFRRAIIFYGIGFLATGLLWDWVRPYSPGIGVYQGVLIVSGVVTASLGMFIGRRFLYPVFSVMTSYFIFESTVSFLYVYDYIEPPRSYWVFEYSDNSIQFDPIRGFRLPQEPYRYARKTYGNVEYVGLLRGNNEGFSDRNDFTIEKKTIDTKRFVVLGDSFTAGQYIKINWPDKVEDLTQDNGSIQLLNFSVDGGGIANWWSILVHIIDKENYEIDGIIFAVTGGEYDHPWNNLRRTFTISDQQNTNVLLSGRLPFWDPERYPKSFDEARPYLHPYPATYVLSTEQFNDFVQGEYSPLTGRTIRPYFVMKSLMELKRILSLPSQPEQPQNPVRRKELIEPATMPLIEDIAQYISDHNMRSLVIHVPDRDRLLDDDFTIPASTTYFAEIISADIANGSIAFQQLNHTELQNGWFPYDGHWNQRGSDRFAEYIAEFLQHWP